MKLTLTRISDGITETVTFHDTYYEYCRFDPKGKIDRTQSRYSFANDVRRELIGKYVRDGFLTNEQLGETHGS